MKPPLPVSVSRTKHVAVPRGLPGEFSEVPLFLRLPSGGFTLLENKRKVFYHQHNLPRFCPHDSGAEGHIPTSVLGSGTVPVPLLSPGSGGFTIEDPELPLLFSARARGLLLFQGIYFHTKETEYHPR